MSTIDKDLIHKLINKREQELKENPVKTGGRNTGGSAGNAGNVGNVGGSTAGSIAENNDDELDEEIDESKLKDFKNNLYQYEEIDKLIVRLNKQIEPYKNNLKPLNAQLRMLKSEKKTIEESLHIFMKQNKIAVCNIPTKKPGDAKGAITISTTTTRGSVTESYVKESLLKFFKENERSNFNSLQPEEKAERVYFYIYKQKPRILKPVIKKIAYAESVNNVERVVEGDDD